MVPHTTANSAGLDQLAERLRELRAQHGSPSFGEIARRVGQVRESRGRAGGAPGRVTVYDIFQSGRSRIDSQLVLDVVVALGGADDLAAWRARLRSAVQQRSTSHARPRVSLLPAVALANLAVATPAWMLGRRAELEGLLAAVTAAAGPPASSSGSSSGREATSESEVETVAAAAPRSAAPRTIVLTGMPGVGKTAIARGLTAALAAQVRGVGVEVALRTASGHSAADHAAPDVVAQEVIALLDRQQPPGADRPLVVFVDDVVDGAEVGVLAGGLPAQSVLVVTSRRRIVVPTTFATLRLEPLPPAGAVRVLRHLLTPDGGDDGGDGGDGGDGDGAVFAPSGREEDLEQIAALCGGLPLALAIVAGQIRARVGWTLADHVERLTISRRELLPALDALLEALPGSTRRVLHLAALHPARLSEEELGLLTDDPDAVGAAVAALLAENLVVRVDNGRLDLHDVVRELATQHANEHEPLSLVRAGVGRLAEALVAGLEEPPSPWFDQHAEVVTTTAQLAADLGLPGEVTTLARRSLPALRHGDRRVDAMLVLDAARRFGDPDWRDVAELEYARTLVRQERIAQALPHVLALAQNLDDPDRDRALALLGDIHRLDGRPDESVATLAQAREVALAAGRTDVAAHALVRGGITFIVLGRADEAAAWLHDALDLLPPQEQVVRLDALVYLAEAQVMRLEIEQGRRHLDRAHEIATAQHLRLRLLEIAITRAALDAAAGTPELAVARLEPLREEIEASGDGHLIYRLYEVLTTATLDAGDLGRAREHLASMIEAAFPEGAETVSPFIGMVELAAGDAAEAERWFTLALEREHEHCVHCRSRAYLGLGDLAAGRGDDAAALALWRSGLELDPPLRFRAPLLERLGPGAGG